MKCPVCKSKDIGEFSGKHGMIWCNSCGTKSARKEIFNPFVEKQKIIMDFIKHVEAKAEEKMLKTGKLEGAHYAAMKELAKKL